MLESEMWQQGKVISNKINTNHTYMATTNYWAPLHEAEEDDNVEEIKQITAVQLIVNTKTNKWTRRIERQWTMKLVIDSGATSKFVLEEMNLPKTGKSNKEVFLPDNTKLQASFEQLSNKAREADILPGLKTPLVSVNKMAEEGYTMVFQSNGPQKRHNHNNDNRTPHPPRGQIKRSKIMDNISREQDEKGTSK